MTKEDQEKNLDNLHDEEEEPEKTEESEEEKEEDEEEKEEFVIPEKFKGKSPEEIAKSYIELEKMIEKKAEEKAKEIIKTREEEFGEEEEEEEIVPPMKEGKPDFSGMTPEQFADWVIQEIEKRAEIKAKTIYEESSKVKESVSAEIATVQESYPLLKTSDEYRELVLAIIESAAQKGETISLEEACKKVEAVIGKKEEIGKEEEKKLKNAKAIVEKGVGTSVTGMSETEDERIKKALLGEGSKSTLGGLGI